MILLVITLACWSAGLILLGRLRGCRRPQTGETLSAGKFSIIIPARNEEHNLPALLHSINTQSVQPLEIIVVDDASTDRTAEVARQRGVRVIPSQPLPPGWRGKTWACQQGAQAATGEVFLFLDADTWFEPDGLLCVLAEFQTVAGGALSVAPHHHVRKLHEQFSAFFNLVMHASPGAFTMFGDWIAPRGLFGQFLLIERASYDRVGGHAAVSGCILENFRLGQHLRAAGVPLHCRSGCGVFSFRMYPQGWREMIDGWIKGFASGAGRTPWPILLLVIAWLTGLILPFAALLTGTDPQLWLAVYGLGVLQTMWLLHRVGRFHWLTAVFYPAPLIFYFIIFARSAYRSGRNKTVVWKGRQICAD